MNRYASLFLAIALALGACTKPEQRLVPITVAPAAPATEEVAAAPARTGPPICYTAAGPSLELCKRFLTAQPTRAVGTNHAFFVKKVGGGMSLSDFSASLAPSVISQRYRHGVTEAVYREHLNTGFGTNLRSYADLQRFLASPLVSVRPCAAEAIKDVTMGSVDDGANFYRDFRRGCYQGEQWLYVGDQPAISLDCGNPIYPPAPPPPAPPTRPVARCITNCSGVKVTI